MLNIKNIRVNPFEENCYIVWDDTLRGVIIDPGCYDEEELVAVRGQVEKNGVTIEKILLTHGHFDHIYGVKALAEDYAISGVPIPVYMDPADRIILENDGRMAQVFGLKAPDASFQTLDVREGDKVAFGSSEFEVIGTPGHTPGGVCYYCREGKALFCGDTLFRGSIGRTDSAWGDYDELITGIMEKLMGLDGDVSVFPGHGGYSSIADERTGNPFLQPFNEPQQDEVDWDADGIELSGIK